MADERKKCAHEHCTCMATGDSDYCSAYCEATSGNMVSDGITVMKCECGHQGCMSAAS